jgi:hypothetical protein
MLTPCNLQKRSVWKENLEDRVNTNFIYYFFFCLLWTYEGDSENGTRVER